MLRSHKKMKIGFSIDDEISDELIAERLYLCFKILDEKEEEDRIFFDRCRFIEKGIEDLKKVSADVRKRTQNLHERIETLKVENQQLAEMTLKLHRELRDELEAEDYEFGDIMIGVYKLQEEVFELKEKERLFHQEWKSMRFYESIFTNRYACAVSLIKHIEGDLMAICKSVINKFSSGSVSYTKEFLNLLQASHFFTFVENINHLDEQLRREILTEIESRFMLQNDPTNKYQVQLVKTFQYIEFFWKVYDLDSLNLVIWDIDDVETTSELEMWKEIQDRVLHDLDDMLSHLDDKDWLKPCEAILKIAINKQRACVESNYNKQKGFY